ncbi:hypothetical protein [Thalassobacillus pellis]|uniref:hypothetical protein n=1 Tax=Thalassobacillus pellis TaxID=748008 RepID=UPI0019614A19|nr:hypothetical protein [Thalassobacillus pellis]MBM7552621.1 hypothetical protein [Thalassobacillus pellis]
MAFGVDRKELKEWKRKVRNGEIAFLTHFWIDDRFPGCDTVTKVGCSDIEKLTKWGSKHGLHSAWIHMDKTYPHFDLFGDSQAKILRKEGLWGHIEKFHL